MSHLNSGVGARTGSSSGDRQVSLRNDDVRRVYRRYAPVYDLVFGPIIDSGRKVAVRHVNERGGRVLEAGVGTGISLPLYDSNVRITAVDLSADMLARARQRVARHGLPNVEAIEEMDISELSYGDESFDIVVSMYTITAVPDPARVMAEFERVCRPGGEVILVSHFKSDGGPYHRVEQVMAPHARRLGWHPAMDIEAVLGQPKLTEIERRRLPLTGIFTMLRLRREP